MAPTTAYDQFDATKGDAFWGCSSATCFTPHQTNATLGVNDMIKFQFSIDGNAQATQFANEQVNFVWGFSTCAATPPTNGSASIGSSLSASNTYSYADTIPICPQMNTASHAGTTTLGSEGLLSIVVEPKTDYGGLIYTAYIGNFVLQLSSSNTNPSTSSSSSSGTTSTTQSSTSSTSSASTGSGSLTNIPLVTPSWGSSGPQPSDGASPGTVGGINDPTPPASNQGVTIGGAVGGAVAVILIIVLIWVLCRRRKRLMEAKENYNLNPTFLTPYDIARANEKNPELATSSTGSTPSIINPNTSDIPQPAMSSGRPPSTVFSATGPPAYDLRPNANPHSLFVTPFAEEEGGHYTLDETLRVHDLLGEWAEEYRDAVPYHLERRLRTGGYVPGTHPDEISPEEWLARFAVTRYELAGLVELFEQTSGMPSQRPRSRATSDSDGDGE